jgi:3,4-dehydroadipyl-CoA semialdehyde dehydrogenase
MRTLTSYLAGRWYAGDRDFQTLVDPSTEEPLARASSAGADFALAVEWARATGGPALAELTFGQRGEILKSIARRLKEHRAELLELSRVNNGATESDGAFDVDGAGGTLAFYGGLGLALEERRWLSDGDGVQLGRSESFWTRHALVPRRGFALHVNAFNFPAWGFAEKFACAFLAGVPVITKPATATALTAHRLVELVLASGLLPAGALQLVIGSTGDLVDRLGAQDVFAFTGSAATARALRARPNLAAASVRVNVEADSLNAAVLGPDVEPGTELFDTFVRDVVREMTQKAGQKCTAVRRILVPAARFEAASEALVARLARVVTGNPADATVRMGPLATAAQLADALDGVAELLATTRLVHGSGRRADGVGAPAGKGYFLAPTLIADEAPGELTPVHEREVFAPVATLIP